MRRWFFSYSFVDAYATKLVEQFAASVSANRPVANRARPAKKSVNVTNFAMCQMIDAAHRFQQQEQLNLFQRSRLVQQLQNQMISRGYTVELARDVAATFFDVMGRSASYAG